MAGTAGHDMYFIGDNEDYGFNDALVADLFPSFQDMVTTPTTTSSLASSASLGLASVVEADNPSDAACCRALVQALNTGRQPVTPPTSGLSASLSLEARDLQEGVTPQLPPLKTPTGSSALTC